MAYKRLEYGKFLSMFDATKRLSWRRQKQPYYWQLCPSHCLAGISMFIHLVGCLLCLQNRYSAEVSFQRNGGNIYICKGCNLQWPVSWTLPLYPWCTWYWQGKRPSFFLLLLWFHFICCGSALNHIFCIYFVKHQTIYSVSILSTYRLWVCLLLWGSWDLNLILELWSRIVL